MKDEVALWVALAQEDLKMAALAFRERIYTQTCFHAQQGAEKLLKAVILHRGKVPIKTHKLADLLSALPGIYFGTLRERIRLLDRFYLPTRYPDTIPGSVPQGWPTQEEAREALETTREVWRQTQKIVKGRKGS